MSHAILTLVSSLGRGGTERVASNFARAYARAGHRSALIAYEKGGHRRAELEQSGVSVFAVGEDGTPDDAISWACGSSWNILHLHRYGWPTPTLMPLIGAVRASSPDVCVLETNVFGKPDRSLHRDWVDVHAMLSRWQMWKWRRWTHSLRPSPIGVVLPNAVDTASFTVPLPSARRAERERISLPSDALVVGCLAQPDPIKWSPALFRAFDEVASNRSHLHLLAVGIPPHSIPLLSRWAPRTHGRIHTLSAVDGDDAVRGFYAAIDIFASYSTMGESFGMVFAEALLSGIPVLTNGAVHRGNSAVEVIGPGGFVAANAKTFTQKLALLADDPTLRAYMAGKGQQHIKTSYDSDFVAQRALVLTTTVQQAPLADRTRVLVEQGWCTDVSTAELCDLQARMAGIPPVWQRAARRLLHHPGVYRLWSTLRGV